MDGWGMEIESQRAAGAEGGGWEGKEKKTRKQSPPAKGNVQTDGTRVNLRFEFVDLFIRAESAAVSKQR